MTEVPQGEHATFSFLDFITLALVLDAIPDFTHGKVLGGFVCLWLAYANHAIGVRWQISRYLIPPAALTLFVCAFVWCIDIKDTEMKYLAAGFVGAVILIAAVAAYSWIGKKESPPEAGGRTATLSSPNPASPPTQTTTPSKQQSVPKSKSKSSRQRTETPQMDNPQMATREGEARLLHPQPNPQGGAGVVGDSAVVEMSGSSQIAGYQTGVLGDHAHVVMKDQSRIEKTASPPPATLAQYYSDGNPRGPVLSKMGIKVPPSDLPLNPVPAGTSSTSSTKDQTDVITALVKEWRDSHPNWTVIGRNSIKWMNQRLEEQGKDFRIQMPEHCNPPYPGVVGLSVPSGVAATLDGVGINGAMVGVEAGQNSTVRMNNTKVVVEENCD